MAVGINHRNLAFVLQVVKQAEAGWIGGSKFRLAVQRDRRENLARVRLEHRRRATSPVKYVKLPPPRVVDHCVGIFTGVGLRYEIERLKVKDGDFVFATHTNKAAIQLRNGDDAMDARGIGDDSNEHVLLDIHYCHGDGMAYIQPPVDL